MKEIKVYLVCETSTLSPEKLLQASLTDGKMLSVQYRVMDAHRKLFDRKETRESLDMTAESDSSFSSA